jgi:hypothetical protein
MRIAETAILRCSIQSHGLWFEDDTGSRFGRRFNDNIFTYRRLLTESRRDPCVRSISDVATLSSILIPEEFTPTSKNTVDIPNSQRLINSQTCGGMTSPHDGRFRLEMADAVLVGMLIARCGKGLEEREDTYCKFGERSEFP